MYSQEGEASCCEPAKIQSRSDSRDSGRHKFSINYLMDENRFDRKSVDDYSCYSPPMSPVSSDEEGGGSHQPSPDHSHHAMGSGELPLNLSKRSLGAQGGTGPATGGGASKRHSGAPSTASFMGEAMMHSKKMSEKQGPSGSSGSPMGGSAIVYSKPHIKRPMNA